MSITIIFAVSNMNEKLPYNKEKIEEMASSRYGVAISYMIRVEAKIIPDKMTKLK